MKTITTARIKYVLTIKNFISLRGKAGTRKNGCRLKAVQVSIKTNDLNFFWDGGTPFGVPPFWFIAIDYFKSLLQMGYLELHTNRKLDGVSLCAVSGFFHLNVCFDFPVITEFVHCTKGDVLGVSSVINSSVKFLIT